ncbi:hypothetical protein NE237_021801 [Protea cynaroides]|uniref:Pectinesterase n=1 Tax=Protea cynaroides TaxID=273540 RepID=A0A9Q0K3L9_9MAGN|nr:hypothetical protein NE237_021801 [Protea cynaroides]
MRASPSLALRASSKSKLAMRASSRVCLQLRLQRMKGQIRSFFYEDMLFVRVLVSVSLLAFVANGDTISSCNQTPYPQICNSFISSNPLLTSKGLRYVALTVTMNQAQLAHNLISAMNLSSFDQRAKAAWADCSELYNDTISELNRVLLSNSWEDTQTWLSAAVANQQTCQNGFIELNSASFMSSLPSMLSNFSKLLGDSLAINNQAASSLSSKPGGARRLLSDGFPSWVSSVDRKLLQLTTAASQANIVVATDESGNYKTISEALSASSKLRSGTSRFVIYVKKGTYKENVEINKSMKNIMLIGDGIDATIVIGSKNVKDGSTTFRSATVGKLSLLKLHVNHQLFFLASIFYTLTSLQVQYYHHSQLKK